MKTILLWDPRFPERRPARLTVEDAVASAAVRAGVATAANPAEAGALSAGGPLDPTMLTEVVLQQGMGFATRRVFLPYSVVIIGAVAGVLAAIGTPIAAGSIAPATPTPSAPPAAVKRMFADNNARITNSYAATASGTKNRVAVRRTAFTGSASNLLDLAPVFSNWRFVNDAPQEFPINGLVTVIEAFVVFNGVSAPVTMAGLSSFTFDGSKGAFEADPIPASAFGLAKISKATKVEVRAIFEMTGTNLLAATGLGSTNPSGAGLALPFNGACYTYDPALTPGYTVAGTAALAVPSGATTNNQVGGILGLVGQFETLSDRVNSVVVIGDSIAANGIGQFLLGWRAASTVIPGVQIAASSSDAYGFVNGNTALREALFQYCDTGVTEFSANDFNNSGPVNNMADRTAYIANRMKVKGISTVFATQSLPRVTNMPVTAGSWADGIATLTIADTTRLVSGQPYNLTISAAGWGAGSVPITVIDATHVSYPLATAPTATAFTANNVNTNYLHDDFKSNTAMYPIQGNFAANGARTTYNTTGLDGLIASGVLFDKIDTSDVCDPNLPWLWKVNGTGGTANGTSRLYCGDGTHPGGGGMTLATNKGLAQLQALQGTVAASPPVNTVVPTLAAGVVKEGQTATTSSNGTWSPVPSSYQIKWQRTTDGGATYADISGASSASRIYSSADVGSQVRVGTLGVNSAGSTDWAYSDPTAVVAAATVALPVIGTAGTISTDGTPQVGETVQIVAASGVTGADSVAYYLRREGVNSATPIAVGAYVLTAGDISTTFELRTVATNSGGSTSAISANVGPVTAAATNPSPTQPIYQDLLTTGTSAQSLTSHLAETPSDLTYTRNGAFTQNGNLTIEANNGKLYGSGQPSVAHSTADVSGNFRFVSRFRFDTYLGSSGGSGDFGFTFRNAAGTKTYYEILYRKLTAGNNGWRLVRSKADGTVTTIVGGPGNLTVATGGTIVEISGTVQTIAPVGDATYPNGAVRFVLYHDKLDGTGPQLMFDAIDSSTDVILAASGRVGWHGAHVGTATTGFGPLDLTFYPLA